MIINPYIYGGASLVGLQTEYINAIVAAGQSANLRLCLDAGDITCATSSTAQAALDTSGQGMHFWRGETSSAEGSDFDFGGTAGSLNPPAYWQGKSGVTQSRLHIQSASNPAWVETLHKHGALFTLAAWIYPLEDTYSHALFHSNSFVSSARGLGVFVNSGNGANPFGSIVQTTGTSGQQTVITSTLGDINLNTWYFVAFSLDESAGNYSFYQNGVSETLASGQWANVSASASTQLVDIGDPNTGTVSIPFNARLGSLACWDRSLSTAQLDDLFTATRTRYGI